MCVLDKINGRSGFDEHENLSGLLDGKKVGDGLHGTIVGDMKILAREALDQFAAVVGNDHANVHALYADAHGLLGNGGWLLRSGGLGTKKKREHEKGGDRGAAHNNFSGKKDFLGRFVAPSGRICLIRQSIWLSPRSSLASENQNRKIR